MLNLDPSKLFVIAVVSIIVLGPNRLPHFARQVGAAWRSFAAFRERMESEVRSSMPDLPPDLTEFVRSPSALLDRLASSSGPDVDPAAAAPQLVADLPAIRGAGQPHWTGVDYDVLAEPQAAGARAESESTVVVDAGLN